MSEKKQSVFFTLVLLGILSLGAGAAQKAPQLIPETGSKEVDSILVNEINSIVITKIHDNQGKYRGGSGIGIIPGEIFIRRSDRTGIYYASQTVEILQGLILGSHIDQHVDRISCRVSEIPVNIPAIRGLAGATILEAFEICDITAISGAVIGLERFGSLFSA